MKNKPTSGNKAAQPNTQSSSPCEKSGNAQQQLTVQPTEQIFEHISEVPVEPYVTKLYVSRRFKMSYRTIQRNVHDGMPSHPIGKRGIRYLVSEVQHWLDQNGRKRFASMGRAATWQELQKNTCKIPVPGGLEIVDGAQPTAKSSPGQKLASGKIGAASQSLLPKCKPGRKPKHPEPQSCRAGRHRWRTSQYTRTCVDCARTEERDAANNWVPST